MTNSRTATIDFESRSACDLRKSGSWKYSLDASTEILCLAFRLPYWKEGRTALWHPAFPAFGIRESGMDKLAELMEWILAGELVEAHNAFFERGLWTNICIPQLGWPAIQPHQWRCSAAKAAAHSLPRSLDDACKALGLSIRKDAAGSKVMLKMSKPRKPRKAELATHQGQLLWHESQELFEQLFAYCTQDVLAEEAVSNALDDLSSAETHLYLLDQTINERGFQLDQDAVHTALSLISTETRRLNTELVALTGGSPSKATQRAQMQQWLADQWYVLEDTKAPTIEAALQDLTLKPSVKKGLELIQALGKASTAKYEAMRNWACPDYKVRGGLLFLGASTGRWSGKGVQPHNFPKGEIKDIQGAWETIKRMDLDAIRAFGIGKKKTPVGDVLKLLSQALRGAIIPSPGKQLYVADYAGIEARVLLWLAGDQDGLGIFRRGEDIYCDMASTIYDRPIISDPVNQPPERALGKIAILGLGYQMGAAKFLATCGNFNVTIDDELAERTVRAYREKYWKVKQLWYDQEAAAIKAVSTKCPQKCGHIRWLVEGRFLYAELPSGRRLAYPDPRVKAITTPWGATKLALSFMGTQSPSNKWRRQTVYGGLLVENLVQAISRDIMAEAMVRCEDSRIYQIVLSVHDELIAEASRYLGDVESFCALVATCPVWAKGCPIEVEGWSGFRYRK